MAVEGIRRPRTQPERKAESARELMRAAVELIAECGWEQASSAEIARRAGYSMTMVNARYGSRDGLLAALLQAYEHRFVIRGSTNVDSGLTELLERVKILREQVRSDTATLRAFLMLCFESVGPRAGHRPWIQAWMTRYVEDLSKVIERGQTDGSIRADLNPRTEAQFFLDAGTGICFTWLLRPETDVDAALADFCRRATMLLSAS